MVDVTQRLIKNPLMKTLITEETIQFNQTSLLTDFNETVVVLFK